MANKIAKTIAVASSLHARPPIVVVMGHVDHGKTTLLDYIRKANIAGREAGGITQAVGAYEIEHVPASGGVGSGTGEKRKITFIDTPGHEAFSAMRARGAEVADLAILVIAADEGAKPQTKEAVTIIQESKTPFIVAINKIDKTGGNLDRARNDLMAAGVMLEGYGGQVSYCGISAKTGEGVSELLDLVLLSADLEGLTYDAAAPATGYVLEARRDPKRGVEATVIVKNGTLRRGEAIRTPTASGKVKILENFLGKTAQSLEPSAPALIIGFDEIPGIGETFTTGDTAGSGATAGAVAVQGQSHQACQQLAMSKPNTLNLILKASDAGSLEALGAVLRGIDQKGGKEINIIDESVGDITDGDIRYAMATKATVIGFKDRVASGAKVLADAQAITVITSDVVYDLATAVEDFFTGKRGPAAQGELEVLALFNQEKLPKQLVGGRVTNGVFREKTTFDVVRGPLGATPLGSGRIIGLREKKTTITQAEKGKEVGVYVEAPTKIEIGDRLVIRK